MPSLRVQNGQVYMAYPALAKMLKLPMPARTSYALTKLARKVGEQYADVNAVRNKLILQYGETENGQPAVKPGMKGWAEFAVEYDELMTEEVELENVWRVTATLPTTDTDKEGNPLPEFKGEELIRLEPFVELLVEEAEADKETKEVA